MRSLLCPTRGSLGGRDHARSKLCWRQPLLTFSLIAGGLVAASCESNAQVFATLRLVAEEQTTDPQLYDGAFDVYHLVADNPLTEAPGFRLNLQGENLIQSSLNDGLVRTTSDFATAFGSPVVDSFFVANGGGELFGNPFAAEPAVSAVATVSSATEMSGLVATSSGFSLPTGNNQVIAVLAVEAGSRRPDLREASGVAYVIGEGPSDVIDPGGDGVDLLDLDGFTFTGNGSAAAVPEPTTLALLALAALGGFAQRR